MDHSQSHYDVLIAGAGPVGLLLACELGLAGCSVLILEQADEPQSPLKRLPFGLRGLSAATVDCLDRRNLLAPLQARMDMAQIDAAAPWMKAERRPAGHFAGIDIFLDQINFSAWRYRVPHAATPMAADLESIETVLTVRALDLGVAIRRGTGVSEVASTGDGVSVRAGKETFQARWLAGCDGARSIVRAAAGFGFAGTEPEFTGYFFGAVLADPDMLAPGHHDTDIGTYIYEPPGMIRMVEFDGGAAHRAPITRDTVEAVLRRISGTPVEVAALGVATTWTDRAYVASKYRQGPVVLAGDAAHIHSPLGGQGLNLGLGDAMNLGWKLARVLRSDAALDLLDSYERERRPVAEQILDWSRAQVALMRPCRSTRALRSIIADLAATRDGATYLAERIWGVGLRYDLGSDHLLVGRSMPDFHLSDGARVNEALRQGRALLLDWEANDDLRKLAERWQADVSYLACDAPGLSCLNAVLVRPDGVIAWASERAGDEANADQLLSQWANHGAR